MIEVKYSPEHLKEHRESSAERMPEARYSYYRRCQVFRRNGEQCKAPAETGSLICHAHAGQLAMAVRREQERRAVLEEAVAELRRRGRPEVEAKDLFMDFNGIQVTLAVMAQALIDGRIDCKTAGRLVVQLQMVSKLLRIYHRGTQREKTRTTKDTKEHKELPQTCADERRFVEGNKSTPLFVVRPKSAEMTAEKDPLAGKHAETQIIFMPKMALLANIRGWPHGPPQRTGAA